MNMNSFTFFYLRSPPKDFNLHVNANYFNKLANFPNYSVGQIIECKFNREPWFYTHFNSISFNLFTIFSLLKVVSTLSSRFLSYIFISNVHFFELVTCIRRIFQCEFGLVKGLQPFVAFSTAFDVMGTRELENVQQISALLRLDLSSFTISLQLILSLSFLCCLHFSF